MTNLMILDTFLRLLVYEVFRNICILAIRCNLDNPKAKRLDHLVSKVRFEVVGIIHFVRTTQISCLKEGLTLRASPSLLYLL